MRLSTTETSFRNTFSPAGGPWPNRAWSSGFGIGPKLILLAVLCAATPAAAQYAGVTGSVPSGPASNEVLRLTLRDAVNMALRYNLGAIESAQNARIARGQRLIALSNLLPQVSAGVSEEVAQTSLATLGIKSLPGIPSVLGPYSFSTADASLSQTLFSLESIQRFRAARTAEQAAQLSYKDTLDVVTLSVGNAYLHVIELNSRIEAQQAQVRNAQALYDQAYREYQAGTNDFQFYGEVKMVKLPDLSGRQAETGAVLVENVTDDAATEQKDAHISDG